MRRTAIFYLSWAIAALWQQTADAQSPRLPAQRNPLRQAAPPVGQTQGPAARTAQAPAGRPAQNPANAAQPVAAPRAPFTLTREEEARLDQLLAAWEEAGKKIDQFSVNFTRLEYRQNAIAAGPGPQANEPVKTTGEIKYKRPDKGLYVATDDKGVEVDHWVTDGKTIFLFNPDKKRVEAHELPPQLQGKGIEDGPLPFLFGTEAGKLKHRYWLRLDPPGTKPEPGQVLLEAIPKFPADQQNYVRAQVILNAESLRMLGLQIYHPDGKSRTVHVFGNPVINPKFQFLQKDFSKPVTPPGWQLVPVPLAQPQPAAAPRAATRPANNGNRAPVGGKRNVVR